MASAAELQIAIRAVDQASAVLRSVGQSTQALGTSARSAGPGFTTMAAAMTAGTVAGNALLAATRGLIGIFGQASGAATDFDQSIASMRSKLSPDDWNTYGATLQQTALRLGRDYPLSAGQAGQAIDLLVQKGVSAKAINEGWAESVVRLSSATGSDLVTAAGIAAAASDAFGVSAEQSGEVVNRITGAVIRGGMSIEDFGSGFQSAGAVVALAGGSIDDVTIGLAAMARRGIEGSDAGTSLKTMYMNLIPTTKEATKVARELGLITADGSNQFFDAAGKARSYEEISRILATATKGLTQEQKLMKLETLFGSDAIRAAAIAAEMGAGEIAELAGAIRQVDAGEVAKQRMDSLKGSVTQFTGSAETLGIVLLGRLAPGFRTIIDTGTILLNNVLEQLDTPEAAAFFDRLGQAAQQTGNDLYTAGQQASELGTALRDVPVVGEVLDSFLQAVGSTLTGVAALMRGDAKGAAAAFQAALGSLADTASSLMDAAEPLIDTVADVGRTIAEAADTAGEQGAWQSLLNGLRNIGETVESTGERLSQLGDTLDRVADSAGVTADPVDVLAAMIRGAADGFEYATVQLEDFVDMILSGIDVAINYLSGISNLGEALQAFSRGDLQGAVQSLFEANDAFVAGEVAAEGYRQRALERVSEGARIMAETVGIGAQQVATSSEEGFSAAATAAEAGMAGAVTAVQAAAPQMAAAAGEGAAGAVAAVEAQQGAAAAAGSGLGSNLGSGMFEGIMAWVGRVAAAARSLVNSAIGAGNVEAEVQSPSKKTRKTGENLGKGYLEGLESVAPAVREKLRSYLATAAEYIPVAGEIKRVEGEIKTIRDKAQTDALFRAEGMIDLESELLRLKKDQITAERDLLPSKRELADAVREINGLERGSLPQRQQLIEMDGQRKALRLQTLDLEQQLVGLDRDSKRAKGIQEQIDKLRDQDSLLQIEQERIRLTNEIAATGARVRKEGLEENVTAQQQVIDATNTQIATLQAEEAVVRANEAIIKNATDNEVAYRERLIAVFRAEGQPLRERIEAGLALIEQLEKEGTISKELADQLRKVGKEAAEAKGPTRDLADAAFIASPPLDAAAQKAKEMAEQAEQLAEHAHEAAEEMSALAQEAADYAREHGSLFDPRPRTRAAGGPVMAGVPYLVGEVGPELFLPKRDGLILPADQTAALLSGDYARALGASGSGGMVGGGAVVHQITIQVAGNTFLSGDRRAAQQLARLLKPELDRQVRGTSGTYAGVT